MPPERSPGLRCRALAPPAEATLRARRLFHPKRGWFRRLERRVSHVLSRHVYPHVPFLHFPYERILRRQLTVAEADISVRGLEPPFDGLRLLLVTDVHTGPFISRRGFAEIVDRIDRLERDLIVLGGDLATSRVRDFTDYAEIYTRLRAPLGVFGVLGNHDHFTDDPPRLAREIVAAGIRLLQNELVVLDRDGARLTLAGIDDLLFGAPDLDAALRGAPRGVPVVLLSHHPDVLFEAAERGVSLVLSGHTHAGQIRVPGLPVIVRMSQYHLDDGRYRCVEAADGTAASGAPDAGTTPQVTTELVVSRGLGAVGLPMRIACPPEVVLLRLRSSP